MCSWPLWRLYKKGSADVCTVASPPERHRVWPTSIRPGPHTALLVQPYHIPSVGRTWNEVRGMVYCACTEATPGTKAN